MLSLLVWSCAFFNFIHGLTITVTQLATLQGVGHQTFAIAALVVGFVTTFTAASLKKQSVKNWMIQHTLVVSLVSTGFTVVGALFLLYGSPDARMMVGATFLVVFTQADTLYWEALKESSKEGGAYWQMELSSKNAAAGLAGSIAYLLILWVGIDLPVVVALAMEVFATALKNVIIVWIFHKKEDKCGLVLSEY